MVWIDEDDRIVRPNAEEFGTDTFADFTGAESGPHLDAGAPLGPRTARSPWTRRGPRAVADLSDDEVLARLHFRIAAEAHRRGDTDTTRRHVLRAGELAPDDLTVWRAGMPLIGEDPFGQDFLDRYDAWKAKGSPAHVLDPGSAGGPAGPRGGGRRPVRVVIDTDRCTGHGRCYSLAPTVFGCDDSGFGEVLGDGEVGPGTSGPPSRRWTTAPSGR